MTLLKVNQTIFFHLRQFLGHIRPFQIQIIRQLLAVKGNIKLPAVLLKGDRTQICQDSPAGAFWRGVKAPAGQGQVFVQ